MRYTSILLVPLLFLVLQAAYAQPVAASSPVPTSGTLTLTLDACGGGFDWKLANFLVDHNIPSTIFATRLWIDHNPDAVAYLNEHAALFTVENHGARHHALILGASRGPYGVPAVETMAGLDAEVRGGASAIEHAFGVQPHWFRGATALYSPAALDRLAKSGWGAAGYSVALDDGASLPAQAVVRRALGAHSGDVLIAHINKPSSGTGAGLTQAIPLMLEHGVKFGHLVRP